MTRARDLLLRLGDEAAHVAAAHVELDHDAPLPVVVADLLRPDDRVDARRPATAAPARGPLGVGIEQAADRVDVAAEGLLETHGDVEPADALEHLARLLAADRRLDRLLHVLDVDAVARDGVAVDLDLELRLPA